MPILINGLKITSFTPLEHRLGVQLLHHPTRRMSLKPEGETYLLNGYPLPRGTWHPRQGDQQQTVKVRGMLSTNDGETATHWALEGHGIVLRSEWDVARHVQSGQLQRILPAWTRPPAEVTLVYPSQSDLSAETRALADFFKAWFEDARGH